jgi:putative ABC transport system substrate-binding protein
MKKLLCIVLAALMCASVLTLVSCSDNDKYTVGICQLVTHPALDQATQGFKDAVIAGLGEENVEFIEQNAGNDIPLCTTIANDFVSKNVDLIMANATPALQAAASSTVDIPILGTSVTEYGVALGINDFDGLVGGNISGTSDLAPLDEQAQMIIDLCPNAEKIGLIYCSAEANSKYQVDEVKKFLVEKGIAADNIKEFAFTDSNDVSAVTAAAADFSDAIYVPTDNTVASNTEIINSVCLAAGVPVVAGEEGICSGCGIATLSISYYDLGYLTGEMAVKILKGEEKVNKMPIQYVTNLKKKYNKTNCDALGITVPEDYVVIE